MSASEGKKSIVQLLKFVLIGASNTILDLLVTFALNAIFGIYYLAKIIGYACGIANSDFRCFCSGCSATSCISMRGGRVLRAKTS